MSMERHRCKLCSKSFLNGKALGGHMRSHLATLPLPIKRFQLTESESSSTRSDHDGVDEEDDEERLGFYGLRENPKRSVKGSLDPAFYHDDDGGDDEVVVQDRESETESTQNNPTRRRSKWASQRRREFFPVIESSPKKCKLGVGVGSESATESTPLSSVSDPSQDEEVARCLMMLSRDVWVVKEEKSVVDTHDSAGMKTRALPAATRVAKFKCMVCKKVFRTSRALAGHKASNTQCCEQGNCDGFNEVHQQKIYECPFCYKVFGSGQALGGHKRSHLLGSSTTNINNVASNTNNADKFGESTSFMLDLNLPAPVEEEDEDY